MLATICFPFLHTDVTTETFCLSLVTSSLVPNIQRAILAGDLAVLQNLPKLVRLIVDNYESDGLAIVLTDILPPIAAFSADSSFLVLYLDAVSSIPSRYRDSVLHDIVAECYESPSPSLRVLAAHAATLVRRRRLVAHFFETLSRDADPTVRVAVVLLLRTCHFDGSLIERVLTNAADDPSEKVQCAAAGVFGDVAPLLVVPYTKLLESPAASQAALESFPSMAQYAGFEPLAAAFASAAQRHPRKCAHILIDLAPTADPSEHQLLFRAALGLRHCPSLIKKLWQFSESFETKRPFARFFKVEKMLTSRERLLYARQCKLFVKDIGGKLLTAALAFAYDEEAEIRNQSIAILVELCKGEPALCEPIASLAKASREQKMVLESVGQAIGEPFPFRNIRNPLADLKKPSLGFCVSLL
jgi:hypothetical protein